MTSKEDFATTTLKDFARTFHDIARRAHGTANPNAELERLGMRQVIESYLAQNTRLPRDMHDAIIDVAKHDLGMDVK